MGTSQDSSTSLCRSRNALFDIGQPSYSIGCFCISDIRSVADASSQCTITIFSCLPHSRSALILRRPEKVTEPIGQSYHL